MGVYMGVMATELPIDSDEEDEALLRRLVYPEEERHLHTPLPWTGGFRWFRSPNVICLERYRPIKTKPAPNLKVV
jgi:hypothetical protein